MKIKKILFVIVLPLIFVSCSPKIKKILSAGHIEQEQFKKTIPFEYTKTGHILLKVTIEGKLYDFILDTGATTIISKELANELNVQKMGSSKIEDINSTTTNLDFVILENIEIGGINFNKTIGSILDLQKGDLACLEVDGLIGSNLMRHAVWDFDFQNSTITITNDESQLDIPSNHSDSKIFIGDAYQVSIITKFNNERVLNNIIDLGNAGNPKLTYIAFNDLKDTDKNMEYITGSGGSGFGAFGRSTEKKSSYSTRINSLTIGSSTIDNVIATSSDGDTNLGLSVFKNYRIIFNWKKRSFKMIKQTDRVEDKLVGFGFTPVFENNKLYVDYLYDDIPASKLLTYRDQILRINSNDYSSVSDEEWCTFFQDGFYKDVETMTITVLRDGKELTFDLKKAVLL